jgi:hypothetical protein
MIGQKKFSASKAWGLTAGLRIDRRFSFGVSLGCDRFFRFHLLWSAERTSARVGISCAAENFLRGLVHGSFRLGFFVHGA